MKSTGKSFRHFIKISSHKVTGKPSDSWPFGLRLLWTAIKTLDAWRTSGIVLEYRVSYIGVQLRKQLQRWVATSVLCKAVEFSSPKQSSSWNLETSPQHSIGNVGHIKISVTIRPKNSWTLKESLDTVTKHQHVISCWLSQHGKTEFKKYYR